jgi:hypothetical protein
VQWPQHQKSDPTNKKKKRTATDPQVTDVDRTEENEEKTSKMPATTDVSSEKETTQFITTGKEKNETGTLRNYQTPHLTITNELRDAGTKLNIYKLSNEPG